MSKIPPEAFYGVWMGIAVLIVALFKQAERLLTAKVNQLIERMDQRDVKDSARDLQRDEVQANVRILTNGTGVHHKEIPRAEPQFNGEPPVIVPTERRTEPREPDGTLHLPHDVPAVDGKYIDPADAFFRG